LLTKRRQIKIWIFGHGFPAQNISKENSAVKKNVWLIPMRIFGLFYFSRQIKSNLGEITSYTSHNFLHLTISLPLSLILRECRSHELPSFSPLIFCGYWQAPQQQSTCQRACKLCRMRVLPPQRDGIGHRVQQRFCQNLGGDLIADNPHR
jgi:hypothetical protein